MGMIHPVKDGLVCSLCGTAAGLLLGWWLIDLVITMAPTDLVSIQDVAVDANELIDY